MKSWMWWVLLTFAVLTFGMVVDTRGFGLVSALMMGVIGVIMGIIEGKAEQRGIEKVTAIFRDSRLKRGG